MYELGFIFNQREIQINAGFKQSLNRSDFLDKLNKKRL